MGSKGIKIKKGFYIVLGEEPNEGVTISICNHTKPDDILDMDTTVNPGPTLSLQEAKRLQAGLAELIKDLDNG